MLDTVSSSMIVYHSQTTYLLLWRYVVGAYLWSKLVDISTWSINSVLGALYYWEYLVTIDLCGDWLLRIQHFCMWWIHGYEGFTQLVFTDIGGDLGTDINVRLCFNLNNNNLCFISTWTGLDQPPLAKGEQSLSQTLPGPGVSIRSSRGYDSRASGIPEWNLQRVTAAVGDGGHGKFRQEVRLPFVEWCRHLYWPQEFNVHFRPVDLRVVISKTAAQRMDKWKAVLGQYDYSSEGSF